MKTKMNEYLNEKNNDILDGDYFVDDENPDNIHYHQLRYDQEDRGMEFSIWTEKGNIEIIVMNEDEFEANSED